MELREFNFNDIGTVRKRCIMYANDGNKVVKHWRNLYPLEIITHHPEFKGFYLEIVNGDYNTDYKFYNDLGKDLILYDWISSWKNIEKEVIDQLTAYLPYIELEGFKKYLAEGESKNAWINNSHIKALIDCGELELAHHYTEYHENQLKVREERERKRHEEYIDHQAEIEKQKQEEITEKVLNAERNFRDKVDVQNVDCDGVSVILYLMRKYGIKVPLKTQGWLNNTLAFVKWDENKEIYYSYYKKKGCKGSQSAFKYLRELEASINRES